MRVTIWAWCMLPCPHLLCMLELVIPSFSSLLSSFSCTPCISWHILRGSCLVQGESSSTNPWCVHCQQGGEIWIWTRGRTWERFSWGGVLHPFCICEDAFQGELCIAFSMLFASARWAFCLCLEEPMLCFLFASSCLGFAFAWFWAAWAFVFLLFRFYAFLLSLFYFKLQVEGVDNALIKGEIESQWTGLIALLVWWVIVNGIQALRWTGGRRSPRWTETQVLQWTGGNARCRSAMGARYTERRFGNGGVSPPMDCKATPMD